MQETGCEGTRSQLRCNHQQDRCRSWLCTPWYIHVWTTTRLVPNQNTLP